jgi:dTDP-glucose 4,6-dehydratase
MPVTTVVTGGAGFVGSHLCELLLARGHRVVCIDDLSSGRRSNIEALLGRADFEFIEHDVTRPLPRLTGVRAIAHLASPASPVDYRARPLETLAVGSRGTENALELADAAGARFVLASTSEVYGDPLVHPQTEDYYGNVNPIGPRSVYDEAKRYAEAVTAAYRRSHGTHTGIVRIFNTYGPRMRATDGRVVSSFIAQALTGRPLTIYGDGSQTRSFCYVSDLVRGIASMLDSDDAGPINLGNPSEWTMIEFADFVLQLTGSSSAVERFPLPEDDPTRRRPDITRAQARLRWQPEVDVMSGLRATIDWFRSQPDEVEAAAAGLAGSQEQGVALYRASTGAAS